MGMLENIQSGKENKPPRIMIYGSEGVGKAAMQLELPMRFSSRRKTVSAKSTAGNSRLLIRFPR